MSRRQRQNRGQNRGFQPGADGGLYHRQNRATFRDDGKVEVVYDSSEVSGHSNVNLTKGAFHPEAQTEWTSTTDAWGVDSYEVKGDHIFYGSLFESTFLEGTETCSMEKPHPDGSCGKPVVVIDNSPEYISRSNGSCPERSHYGYLSPLVDSLMGSGSIVKCHIFLQHVVEMAFIQDEDVIQAFLSS